MTDKVMTTHVLYQGTLLHVVGTEREVVDAINFGDGPMVQLSFLVPEKGIEKAWFNVMLIGAVSTGHEDEVPTPVLPTDGSSDIIHGTPDVEVLI